MGDPNKDNMDLDDHQDIVNQASPRPSLQIPTDNLSPRLSVQVQQDRDSEDGFNPPNNELPPSASKFSDEKLPMYDFSPPMPSVPERRASQFEVPPAFAERRASQYDMPPPMIERRASQYDNFPPERRASQFDMGGAQLSERRPSSMLHIDKEALYGLPDRSLSPVLTSAPFESLHERPSLLQQQQYLHSAAQTPRMSSNNFVPVKRDSGFVSSQGAINEADPYSPASAVSSSVDGVGCHIDRDAMLARAYQDKQQSQVRAWERHRNTRNFNKYESDVARITAWESCQVAKCEALMKRSEEELEKKRVKLREGFKNEIASIHRRADEWKALTETRRVEEILRTEEGAARFRATGKLPKKPLLHIQSLRDMCCGFNLPYKRDDLASDKSCFAARIRSCGDAKEAKSIHAGVLGSTHKHSAYLANLIVQMYGNCGCLREARAVFDLIQDPDVFAWNIIIAAYANNKRLEEAKRLFDRMPNPNTNSWNSMIAAFSREGRAIEAKWMFDRMPNRNLLSWNAMLAAFALNGNLSQAQLVLARMPEQNVVTWNTMLMGFAREGDLVSARNLYENMLERNLVSYTSILQAYAENNGDLQCVKQIFDSMPEWSIVCWSAMIQAYIQAAEIDQAVSLFKTMAERNLVSWNALVAAYAREGICSSAKDVFDVMPEWNAVSWTSMLQCYARCGRVEEAKFVFDTMPERDLVSWIVMFAGFAANGYLKEAEGVFSSAPERSLALWTGKIALCFQKGDAEEARRFFFGGAMPERNVMSWTVMVVAFARAGEIELARKMFERMLERDTVLWNAMALAYAHSGELEGSISLVRNMSIEGFSPDEKSFVNVLAACNHKGSLEMGKSGVKMMCFDFGIDLQVRHLSCMVDICGRTGQTQSAKDLMQLVREPCGFLWDSLLGAFQVQLVNS